MQSVVSASHISGHACADGDLFNSNRQVAAVITGIGGHRQRNLLTVCRPDDDLVTRDGLDRSLDAFPSAICKRGY